MDRRFANVAVNEKITFNLEEIFYHDAYNIIFEINDGVT